ncbi:MAG: two-component regulator propeller domain-containing protein [Bacteroidia bacterium]
MKHLCNIFIILLFAFTCKLKAQQYYFANYTLNDGLPHSRVNDLLQGSDGYLWLATNLGLSRFDGHKFINYSYHDGLADNKVTCIYEISAGELLLGHENGELSYIKPGVFVEKLILSEKADRIFEIYPDRQGNIWIGTQSAGVFRVKKEEIVSLIRKKEFDHFDETNGLARDVTSILEDKDGLVWFITDLGIKRSRVAENKFEFYLPHEIDFVQFSAIAGDSSGQIWLGTVTSGVYCLNNKGKVVKQLSVETGDLESNFVSVLTPVEGRGMLAGTWGGGFCIIDKNFNAESITENNGLSENKVRCLGTDREGNIWIGSNQNGVSCFRGKDFQLYLRSKDGTNTPIGAICTDKRGNHWLGSNNGIFFIPAGKAESKRIDFLTGGDEIEVTSIIEDRKGNIWLSTWGAGILIINPVNFRVERFSGKLPYAEPGTFTEQYVHTIKQASNGKIWISMLRGISVFDPGQNTLHTYTTHDGLTENSTTDIEEDGAGKIWIGTAGSGVTIWEKGKFLAFKPAEAPVYPAVSSLTLDEKGLIWIATEGGGIYSTNGEKTLRYTTAEGIPSNYVSFIESDQHGKLWMGTNRGISVWSAEHGLESTFDRTDRVQRIEPKPNAVSKEKNGNIWIGTINGVLEFNPSVSIKNKTESVTHITAVKVFQDTISAEGTTLNYKRNYLSFYFNGICYSDPQKVKYRYHLKGFDDSWQESELNFVTYNNLPPGEYTFELKSCNNDGLWNKEPVAFSFTITPPYWMTWWFYTVVVLGLILIVFLFIKFRERNLQLEKKHLEQLVGERTGEIMQQKVEIEQQRDELKEYSNIIEQKNLSITDSIKYAKRIQLATLPYSELILESLPHSFILYKPKDIVSGDFYAFAKREQNILLAAADCTGHGVPGAFMSMIGTNLFSQVINEKGITRPASILDELNVGIERALKQDETENHDGMDIVVVSIDFENRKFEMAGANRPLWIIRKEDKINKIKSAEDAVTVIRPDKQPIGGFSSGRGESFTNHNFEFNPGDVLYLFTDGFADQFGGPSGKKLLSKRLREKLYETSHLTPDMQKEALDEFFENWRGNLEQVDDVLIVGIFYPDETI